MQAMREFGLVDEDLCEEISYLGWHFGNETARRWWEYIKPELDPEFAKKVDEALATESTLVNRETLDAMLPPKDEPEKL